MHARLNKLTLPHPTPMKIQYQSSATSAPPALARQRVGLIDCIALPAFLIFFLAVTLPCAAADIIAQWTFNSPESDANAAPGNAAPAIGFGLSSSVGSATGSFGKIGTSPDPATDNSSWRLASFPAQYTGNKSSG